jgi:hypothetical protein
VEDVEQILGNGAVQLRGDGARRLKRLEQQKLFKDEALIAEEAAPAAVTTEEAVLATMDAQMELEAE